jgi:hypothetical protein
MLYPRPSLTFDRADIGSAYRPGGCRWAYGESTAGRPNQMLERKQTRRISALPDPAPRRMHEPAYLRVVPLCDVTVASSVNSTGRLIERKTVFPNRPASDAQSARDGSRTMDVYASETSRAEAQHDVAAARHKPIANARMRPGGAACIRRPDNVQDGAVRRPRMKLKQLRSGDHVTRVKPWSRDDHRVNYRSRSRSGGRRRRACRAAASGQNADSGDDSE